MDLTPDPLLERLGRTLRSRLAQVPPSRDADALDGALAVWRESEAPAFESPVASGGLDLGLATGTAVCAELGRCALPDVYAGGALVADALRAGDAGPEPAAMLARGELTVTVAGLDRVPARSGRHGAPVARRVTVGWELAGRVTIDAVRDEKAHLCVPVVDGDETLLALLASDVVADRARPAPGGSPVADLTGVVVTPADLVGSLGSGWPLSDPGLVLARARVRQAAYLLGLAQGGYELAVAHARSRRQFDRPITEFQAVSFPLAQASIALSAVRLSVLRAAWSADHGMEFARQAAQCLAMAAETATRTIRHAVQVHGARGMSRQAAVHVFYEALRSETARFGQPGALWCEAGARRLAERLPECE
ncbi:acyl-CoA dehydrogenase family protein [Nonomuraea sp. NPDC052116]|uniref:acyl-CoA dehydrogenase family protein n=1 Tax=Nonomuraea sp. NPDC052116 TaxID=3155665 RepID=UPI003425E57D